MNFIQPRLFEPLKTNTEYRPCYRSNFFNKVLATSDYATKAYSNSTLLLAFIKFKYFCCGTYTVLQ